MKHVLKVVFGILSILLGGCVHSTPQPQPVPPTTYTVACVVSDIVTHAPIKGAACGLGNELEPTNADGYAAFQNVPAGNVELHVGAVDYESIVINQQIMGNTNIKVALQPVKPNTKEPHVPLHATDSVFRRPDGSIFRWLGASDFSLYAKFLDGKDIGTILSDRVRLGFTVLRVFGMVDSFTHLHPREHADYYTRLPDFAQLVGSYGLRMEFVVFADAQVIMPSVVDERVHIDNVRRAFNGAWNVTLEVGNECYKNIPGGDETCRDFALAEQGQGLLVAVGSVETGPFPPLRQTDYGTHHTERDAEWPRKAKDIYDVWEATRIPFVADEPIGAAEIERPGSRTTSASDYRFYCANAALFGGVTFHSDLGVTSDTFTGKQREMAQACVEGSRFVPVDAPTQLYQRGGDDDGPGVGNIPVMHRDSLELRTYCKGDSGHETCIQTRTQREHATPRDGWRVVAEPWQGFVTLEK